MDVIFIAVSRILQGVLIYRVAVLSGAVAILAEQARTGRMPMRLSQELKSKLAFKALSFLAALVLLEFALFR